MKNNKFLLGFIVLFSTFYTQLGFAQLPDGFDIKAAYAEANQKGVPVGDVERYVKSKHIEYLHNNHKSHSHISEPNGGIQDMGTIFLNGAQKPSAAAPNSPQNAYCPNAGFEQNTFANWTGGYGAVATGPAGSGFPTYNQTAATIMNGAGNNVGLMNTTNYHTIMTTAAINNVHPNLVGYDSIASRVIGTQTVSEIPFVNPAGGPTSVRLNSPASYGNYRAAKLNYQMALNPNNKNFSVSYALILENAGHNPNEQPYFSVKVTDQNGNLVPGCSQYTITCSSQVTVVGSPIYDPLWKQSSITYDALYRPWQTFAFDFSNYPTITSVNVEFYVGGCSQGGHWGYAYVDAACSQGGAVASFCAGSNASVLTAPAGYNTYQWIGPSGPVSVSNGGNTPTATISPVSAGQVFSCNVTAPNGCSSSFQTTIAITTVSITGVGSTPSCQNGGSGTAFVSATGSSLGYSYQWLNSMGGNVGTTQTATGLSPGTYSVVVSSPLCGAQTATVSVGVSPPSFYSLPAPYCGTVAWITKAGGSNYKWYTASPLALIPGATSSSLTINSPINGTSYFLVYNTASGCKDSIKYTLSQSPGGSIYASNIKSICAGNNNSYAVINLNTTAPPAYSYTVTGPGGYNSVLNNTTLLKDSVVGLSIGTYSATVFDGQCLYNTTFTVSPFVYSYTLTPSSANICTPGSTSLAVNFGNTTPTACGLSSTGGCTTPNQITLGTGTTVNSTTSYPAIYSNWYRNARHQILYRASELLAAGILPGKISSISWNITTINGTTTYPDFTIKMKCTNVTDLSSFTFDQTGLTQVYYSPSINITTGWNTYQFPVAYEWDGVSNILIDVCTSQTPSYSNNSSSPYSTTPFISVRYYNADGTVACPITSASSTSSNRPNIRFANCGGSNPAAFNYTWTPSAGLSSTTTYTTMASPTVTTVYTVQVNPIGQTNCMQAQSSTITVVVPVPATVTPVNAMCSNASTVNLTATPSGGTWSGSGVSPVGVLTPSLAAIGNNTYTYSIGSGSCSSVGNTTISIEKFVPSTIGGTISPICLPGTPVNLSTALTTSTLGAGTWAGNGVTGSTFDPVAAGIGTHTLTYNTSSSPTASLCPSSSTIAVTINSAAQPTITAVGPFCTNANSLTVVATPSGGTWIGSGISTSGVLSPSVAAVGNNTYTYTVGSSTCSATGTTTISIEQFVPSTITGSVNVMCISDPVINLATALSTSPLGTGVWSGNGISGTSFDPSVAGSGVHTITYSTNSNPTASLCPSSSTINLTVNSVVQPTITPAGPFCDNFTSQQLSVSPSGGMWSASSMGTSVTGSGLFSPASSSLGTNKIYYTLTNAPCSKKDSVDITVVHFVPATIIGALGPYCIYDPSVNLQPTAQFTGGTWSGNGVTGTSFSPSTAGAGVHTITYSTDPTPNGLCPDSKSLSIIVNPKPVANAVPNTTVGCTPVTIDYSTTTVNLGSAIWDFGDGTPRDTGLLITHVYDIPGTYTATLYYTDPAGCKDTTIASSGIKVNGLPVASFQPSITETTVVDGQVEFTNQSTVLADNTYAWDIGGLYGSNNVDESYLFLNSGDYVVTLTATTVDGCTDDTSVVIKVNPDVVIYVPNAFTPGSDGLNDVFQVFIPPSGADYSTYSIVIYDRWGELIFQSNDITQSWTGAKNNSGPILKQDVYVWKIHFQDEKKKHYDKIGHVSLLRK
jgi:gliding motility-associated-like protein